MIELRALLRPAEDLAAVPRGDGRVAGRGELRDWQDFIRDWVLANDQLPARDPRRLRDGGPLPVA